MSKKKVIKAKKEEILLKHSAEYANAKPKLMSLPMPAERVWFNIDFNKRGEKHSNPVVSLTEFLSISFYSFSEICKMMSLKDLKKLDSVISISSRKRAGQFRHILANAVERKKS